MCFAVKYSINTTDNRLLSKLSELPGALRQSQICVTCTPSKQPSSLINKKVPLKNGGRKGEKTVVF
jgi:hypothetical protein